MEMNSDNSDQTQIDELRRGLYEQEHRGFIVLKNFLYSLYSKKDRMPCLKALLFYLAPTGSRAIILIGGTSLGFFTLSLMQKNNELLQDQNFFFQHQIYVQTKTVREQEKSEQQKILYEESTSSLSEYSLWVRYGRITEKPKRTAKHGIPTRQIAFERLARWNEVLLIEPKEKNKENMLSTIYRTYCESIGWACEPKPENAGDNLNRQGWIDYEILVGYAFFEDLDLYLDLGPSDKIITFRAKNSNFDRAVFVGSYFGDIKGSSVKNAVMKNIDWVDSGLASVDFTDTNMSGSNFKEAHFENSILIRANLKNTNLIDLLANGANFESANLTNSNVYGADFSNTNLTNSNFTNASFGGQISLDNADVTNANFTTTSEADFKKGHGNLASTFSPLTCDILTRAKNWQKAITSIDCNTTNSIETKRNSGDTE